MHLANRYATRVILASFTAVAISSFVAFAVSAQDPGAQDPTQQQKGSTDKPAGNGATATAAPSPPPKRLGNELDDRTSVITNEKSFYGERLLGYLMDPDHSVNIDNVADWQRAELLISPPVSLAS